MNPALSAGLRHNQFKVVAASGGGGGVKLRLNNSIGTNVTESGSALAGWNYAGTALNCFDPAWAAVSVGVLGVGINGYVSAVLDVLGDTSGRPFVIGLYASVDPNYPLPTAAFGGNGYYYEQYTQYASSPPNGTTGRNIASGDIVKITRTGTTIVCDVQRSGVTTVIHTYTGASTGAVHVIAYVSGSVHVNNIQTDNIA